MITARFYGNLNHKPIAKKIIHFENSGDISSKSKEFIDRWA